MKFVRIPAGDFLMGSPNDEKGRDADEGPVHKVTLSKPFYLGIHEVTQDQWAAVMNKTPSEFQPRGDNPVEKVCWDDCEWFIAAINKLGLGQFRLPTEAEWEYACRAGTNTRFYWGDDPDEKQADDYAWYEQDSTSPVGRKKPNAWGLYDMGGNVWEWCSDWFGDYPGEAQRDPQGPCEGEARVSRGGGWRYQVQYCRSADRYYALPNVWSYLIGLRL
ncbi:MAG: formylglycine-generating enzyme family protein, partial [bacterium]